MKKVNLESVRILDFTWAWAGPFGTLLLAFMGAEILKVESAIRLDHSRTRSLASGPGHRGPNQAGPFNDLNLNKKSITLNLSDPRGVELIRRLVPHCDVVANNFRPGVMEHWGIGYENLRKIKPDIIMLSSSACGAVGAERHYIGYAPSFCALGGISHITGYSDRAPVSVGGRIDTSSGTAGAYAILAALIYRNRTGLGQHIDFSSREAVTALIGESIMEYLFTGTVPMRGGNRESYAAPHNAYRCEGYDAWISIVVTSEEEWHALCDAMGRLELKNDPRFKTLEDRVKHCEELDQIVSQWTIDKNYYTVMEILQARGVAAVPTFDGQTLSEDEHIKARHILSG
jgi:benzylsuccinate CoA-transferase BbsF subunit